MNYVNSQDFSCVDTTDINLRLQKFIPDSISTPIKTIHLSFHIWRDDNGNGNFWLNQQAYRDTLRLMISFVNEFFNDNQPFSDPVYGAPLIKDTKIRFHLDSVYYYNNTQLSLYPYNDDLTNFISTNHPERLSSFPYHLTMSTYWSFYGASSSACNPIQSIFTTRQIPEEFTGGNISRFWGLASHIAHEFGHNFNLGHTYEGEVNNIHSVEFLWDLFGTSKQQWCNIGDINTVCYHDASFDCDPFSADNTCTNNIMGGVSTYNRHITALQCARIHRSLALNHIRDYTWGYNNIPHEVTSNQIWYHSCKMYQDIVVKSGNTFTISGEILMPYQSKIIVERGAKLIIDGGKITSSSKNTRWQGIEIWGSSNKSQYVLDLPYQGQLEIINNGIIENAEIAVFVGKRDANGNNISGFEGGLIKATNATFLNNKISIYFNPYHNYNPGNPSQLKSNLSVFKNTQFETNSNWINSISTFPDAFVKLYEVDGINFRGCAFVNSNPTAFLIYNRGKGISSIDAYYVIDDYCSISYPCSNPINTIFQNLYYAIESSKALWDNYYLIKNAIFTNNYRSIYIDGLINPTIMNNTFYIPDFNNDILNILPNNNQPYGLYLNYSTGYIIENNHFNNLTTNKSSKIGLIVNFSGTANNRIYNNYFNSLSIGSSAQGQNRGSNSGLTYKCNEFTDCLRDISLTPYNRFYGVIAPYQGSLTSPAANIFSHASTTFSDIYNESWWVNYYHNTNSNPTPRWIPKNYSTSISLFNTSVPFNKTTQCPVTGMGGGMDKLFNESNNLIGDLSSQILILSKQLENLIDNGNTNLLLDEINNSPSWNALELRNSLISKSPYLSDTSLITAIINEQVLPPIMLSQILEANPHSSKSNSILEHIFERSNQIPQYLMSNIYNSRNIFSPKDHLESQILTLNNERSILLSKQISEYKKEKTDNFIYNIIELMNIEDETLNILNKYTICLSNREFYISDVFFNQIQNSNNPDLIFIANLAYRTIVLNSPIDSLTILEHNTLNSISSNQESIVNSVARNILLKLKKSNYNEPIIIHDNQYNSLYSPNNFKTNLDYENSSLIAYPNPVYDYIIIGYKSNESDCMLDIIDSYGRPIKSYKINNTDGEILFETSKLISGSYYIKYYSNNQILKTIKFNKTNN